MPAAVTELAIAPVTLMSEASFGVLEVPDPRRFRMTITIDGASAPGRSTAGVVASSEAVTGSGRRDAPTLKRLAQLRGRTT